MSAYLVSNDTLDLLASAACRWSEGSHMGGLDLYLSNETKPLVLDGLTGDSSYGTTKIRYALDSQNASKIKEELYLENIRSLAARYSDAASMVSDLEPYRGISRDDASLEEVLGAIRCYQYQACESEEWETSFAYELTEALMHKIARMISDGHWDYDRNARREAARARIAGAK